MKLLEEFIGKELNFNAENFMCAFSKYEELLLEENKKINLVSRKTVSIEEHILNSVFFLTNYDLKSDSVILDLGTGGGFPGIPLKILFPDLKITFVDSVKKKTTALSRIIEKLKLTKTEVTCGRAEEISVNTKFNSKFDIVISKAVAPLKELFDWGKDFLKPNGEILCIKGGNLDNELKELDNTKTKSRYRVISYEFAPNYKIEDKKLVVLKKIKNKT